MRMPAVLALLLAVVALAGCAQPAQTQALADEGGDGEPQPTGSADRAPAATLQATPSSGRAPLDVVFSLSARDPEGHAVQWRLDFGDGTPARTGDRLPIAVEHRYQGAGTWSVTFQATDGPNTAVAKVAIRASFTQAEQGPPTSASSTPTGTTTTTAPPPPPPAPPSSSTSSSTSPSPSNSTSASSSTTATASSSSSTTASSTSSSASSTTAPTSSSSTSTTSDPTSSTSETSTTTSSSTSTSETQTSTPPDNGTAPP